MSLENPETIPPQNGRNHLVPVEEIPSHGNIVIFDSNVSRKTRSIKEKDLGILKPDYLSARDVLPFVLRDSFGIPITLSVSIHEPDEIVRSELKRATHDPVLASSTFRATTNKRGFALREEVSDYEKFRVWQTARDPELWEPTQKEREELKKHTRMTSKPPVIPLPILERRMKSAGVEEESWRKLLGLYANSLEGHAINRTQSARRLNQKMLRYAKQELIRVKKKYPGILNNVPSEQEMYQIVEDICTEVFSK